MQLDSKSPEETQKIAEKLIQAYPDHKVWLLEGDLAAGKTHLVKGLAKALALSSSVHSPTFAYLNEYEGALAHYDLYRLESEDQELLQLLNEHFEAGIYVAIEWPSRMEFPLIKSHLQIKISHEGGDHRSFEITPLP